MTEQVIDRIEVPVGVINVAYSEKHDEIGIVVLGKESGGQDVFIPNTFNVLVAMSRLLETHTHDKIILQRQDGSKVMLTMEEVSESDEMPSGEIPEQLDMFDQEDGDESTGD